jgi:hypothetical protein
MMQRLKLSLILPLWLIFQSASGNGLVMLLILLRFYHNECLLPLLQLHSNGMP